MSRDPLGIWGDPGQMGNGQSYCGNNPVNRVDPMGEFAIIVIGPVVVAVEELLVLIFGAAWLGAGIGSGAFDEIGDGVCELWREARWRAEDWWWVMTHGQPKPRPAPPDTRLPFDPHAPQGLPQPPIGLPGPFTPGPVVPSPFPVTPVGLGTGIGIGVGVGLGGITTTLAFDPTKPAEHVLPGSLRREFPGEHLKKSLNQIKEELKTAEGAAKRSLQKAKKLLEQARRLLEKNSQGGRPGGGQQR